MNVCACVRCVFVGGWVVGCAFGWVVGADGGMDVRIGVDVGVSARLCVDMWMCG